MKKRIVTLLTTALLLSFAFSSTVSAAGFVQDTSGVKFQNDDGSFAANTWVQAGTGIYHLDAAGFVQTGWIQVGELWYYLDETGVCTTPEGSPVGPNAEAANPAPAAPSQTAPAQSVPAPAQTAPAPDAAIAAVFEAAGWTLYAPTDATLLQNGIAAGLIGFDGARYWASPVFTAALAGQTVPAPQQQEAPQVTADKPQEKTVYITATGNKYHRASCRYLEKSKISIDLSDALAAGYGACKVCRP